MKKILVAAIVVVLAYQGVEYWRQSGSGGSTPAPQISSGEQSPAPGASPEGEPRSGQQFEGEGTVVRVLADDNQGSRHQRFIVRLRSGRTVLIAHNIDLAPRVPGISEGDTLTFSGEFEDNDKGGVVHWTHHDPSGRHVAGWIKHGGKVFQ